MFILRDTDLKAVKKTIWIYFRIEDSIFLPKYIRKHSGQSQLKSNLMDLSFHPRKRGK